MKRASILFFSGLLICLMASAAHAGGFGLFEWGNRAIGMGTANYATGNDASVVAYNPALMTKFDSPEVMAGLAAIAPSSDVNITDASGLLTMAGKSTGDYSTEDQTFMVPHAFYVHPLSDTTSLGLGVFTRFGLGTKYADDWGGRYMLKEIMLESVSVNPSAAFQVTDKLSLAFGVEILQGSMYLKRAHPAGGDVTMNVDGVSVGGNIAANYDFNDQWNLGFHYRSPIKFTGDGSVEAADIPGGSGGPQSGDATVSATFPSSYSLGLGYRPTSDWTFEASVIHTRWDNFDEMKFSFDNVNSALIPDNDEKFYYKNTWRFQLGGEYMISDMFAVRAGYVYDQTPTRHDHASVMLPANDRSLYSLGLGIDGGSWYCDLSGMYVTTKSRSGMSTTVAEGSAAETTYEYEFKNGQTLIGGLSAGYRF